ncbi:MAG: ATPase [Bacteroides sp.]|nr:ATPase [Bacteroides sp.]
MTLIADAGSTKIEWVLFDNDGRVTLRTTTRGHNAAISHPQSLAHIIQDEAPALWSEAQHVDEIYYYGAGCVGNRCITVAQSLSEIFNAGVCHAESDMLGAARALCGTKRGIACIIGTGSNSCLYDGEKIVDNVSPLGFILGDEGSGAVLGRKLIGMVMKGGFSREISDKFHWRFPEATKDEIIARVYRSPHPNAYLASFVPFLSENIAKTEIADFVVEEFIRFFDFNVRAYADAQTLPVNFTGSVAFHFAPQLRQAAEKRGYHINRIEKAPMESLVAYHSALKAD